MAEVSNPLLVYSRIDANRRRTWQLLALFVVVSLPFASGATVWLLPLVSSVGLFVVLLVPSLMERLQEASLEQAVLAELTVLGSSLLLVAAGLTAATIGLIYRYSSALVLRAATARAVSREAELHFHRVVESLCVGAGLPKPRLYVIESSTPNAFALGRDPQQASLVVTRGLLTLLDRRELEGVVAHELSHIGNQDIRLNTALSGLVGALTLPLTVIMAVLRLHPIVAVVAAVVAMPVASSFLLLGWMALTELPAQVRETTGQEFPPILWWWGLHALVTPFYMVLVAPLLARLLKRCVSHEREFLADADAVALTRNPEALALALVKVASAHGTPIRVGPATTHIYFVDPVPDDGPWLTGWFRSHPPVEDRLDLLARMGSGVAPLAVLEAIHAGVARREMGELAHPATTRGVSGLFGRFTQQKFHPALVIFVVMVMVRLWRGSLGFADILLAVCAGVTFWYYATRRELPAVGQSVPTFTTPLQQESGITLSDTQDNAEVQANATELPVTLARMAEEAELGERLRLAERTTLLVRPDGWSDIVEQLPKGTTVTLKRWDAGFVQVETDGGSVGYVGRRTPLVPMVDRGST